MACKPNEHKYELLDVEKIADTSPRYYNIFKRTTRLFCQNCGEIKEIKEHKEIGFNEDRPVWTHNCKKI